MSLLLPPQFAAAMPDNGLKGARMPRGFEVLGATDGSNPLYDRSLSVADRLAGAHLFFKDYCQRRSAEIDLKADKASRIDALKELKTVLEFVVALKTNSAEILKNIDVKALMGENMVGPDAKIFAGRDIGAIPALPDNIVEILKSRCELAVEAQSALKRWLNSGCRKSVAQTHRLVLIPASIDGVATSVISLRKFAEEVCKGRDRPFYKYDPDWYANEEFANRPLPQSKWVLMYGTIVPNTGDKTDAGQMKAIERYKNHETVDALGAIGTLVLGYLEHGRRDFSGIWARTEGRSSWGGRVGVGGFDADGLLVHDMSDRGRESSFGRAVCRRLT